MSPFLDSLLDSLFEPLKNDVNHYFTLFLDKIPPFSKGTNPYFTHLNWSKREVIFWPQKVTKKWPKVAKITSFSSLFRLIFRLIFQLNFKLPFLWTLMWFINHAYLNISSLTQLWSKSESIFGPIFGPKMAKTPKYPKISTFLANFGTKWHKITTFWSLLCSKVWITHFTRLININTLCTYSR